MSASESQKIIFDCVHFPSSLKNLVLKLDHAENGSDGFVVVASKTNDGNPIDIHLVDPGKDLTYGDWNDYSLSITSMSSINRFSTVSSPLTCHHAEGIENNSSVEQSTYICEDMPSMPPPLPPPAPPLPPPPPLPSGGKLSHQQCDYNLSFTSFDVAHPKEKEKLVVRVSIFQFLTHKPLIDEPS